MATPETSKKCYYVQHDPHKCKIKLEKFHFDILCRFGVIKESLPGGRNRPPPPGEIGLMRYSLVIADAAMIATNFPVSSRSNF